MSTLKASLALASAPILIGVALVLGFNVEEHEANRALIHREENFVGEQTCQRCHPDQHASWARTFHATMTQRVDPTTIVGRFDGRAVEFYGKRGRPYREGDRFFMDIPDGETGRRVAEVELAVGSRRYQQYFERIEREGGAIYRRLPILYHIEAQRWLHLNDVFLQVDNPDWDAHGAVWNQNCIFCHNTGPRPGYVARADGREIIDEGARAFDSRVASLGIACEACHGPAKEHLEKYDGLFTRYVDYLDADNDTRIVNPKKLDHVTSTGACGQCHGQRIPKPLENHFRWRVTGPTFRSGNELTDHVTPVRIDTKLPGGKGDEFELRFWRDGTPRLTAYEYQGVTTSPCYERGELSCMSCHVMHGGDVRGQIEPEMRGNRACTQCHEDIGKNVSAHTKHAPESSGSLCMDCHMPRIVYGVVELHRSHHIEIPDPARDAENGRPNACTLCHLDKSPLWAAGKMREFWGPAYRDPKLRLDKAPLELSDAVASMLAGDAVQRVTYAKAMGRDEAAVAPADTALLRVALHATLLDAYPSIRWTAQKSLLRLEERLDTGVKSALEAWRHDGPKAERDGLARTFLDEFRRRSASLLRPPADTSLLGADFAPRLEAIIALLNLQSGRVINIGE
ncbi:MAG TPA: cytochrome c3 family protein [Planctomycetota bacterium]|nr:cytochrome c3 family protein [Planctomycetota bacterium]